MMMDENKREERQKRKRAERRKKLIFTGCGILISALFLGILFCTGQLGTRTALGVTSVEQYNLIETEGIEQEIEINYNYLDSLFLFIANMEEGQEGALGLELVDEEDKIVFSKEYSLKEIEIGAFQKLTVHKFLKPGKYTLKVNYSGDIPEFGIDRKVLSKRTDSEGKSGIGVCILPVSPLVMDCNRRSHSAACISCFGFRLKGQIRYQRMAG